MRVITLVIITLIAIFGQESKCLEEDDSVRCRLSGICEGFPTPQECQDPSYYSDIHRILPGIRGRASRRDAKLACTFDPIDRADRIRDAARWTWKGYKDCALGQDELRPLSCSGQHWFNLTLTPIDGLDTLYLLNLHEDFQDAVNVILHHYNPQNSTHCNLFETTIRVLGGLLSAHHLSAATHPNASHALLQLAVDLGSRLAQGFLSPSGIPFSDVNLSTGTTEGSVEMSSTAEIATLSLEFTMLARLTGKKEFETAALKVHDIFTSTIQKSGDLLPQFFSWNDGTPSLGTYYMLGARKDSYYEYLLKQWILTGKTDDRLLHRFIHAMRAVRSRLLQRTSGYNNNDDDTNHSSQQQQHHHHKSSSLLYVAEEVNSKPKPKMDHLVCFLPGVLALADYHNISTARPGTNDPSDLDIAIDLAQTCYELYKRTPTGLAPEIVYFTDQTEEDNYPGAHVADIGGGDFSINENDAHNLLRPETVESFYLLYKVTGDPIWRERAWSVFRAFELWSKVDGIVECVPHDAVSAAEVVAREVAKHAVAEAAAAIARGATVEEATEEAQTVARRVVNDMRLVDDGDDVAVKAGLAAAEAAAAGAVMKMAMAMKHDAHSSDDIDDHHHQPNQATTTTTNSNNNDNSNTNDDNMDGGLCYGTNGKAFKKRITGGGYTNLQSVVTIPPTRLDKMESFWLAETLKYLYLIFNEQPDRCLHPSCGNKTKNKSDNSDNSDNGTITSSSSIVKHGISLSSYVFNTEAHPLPVVGPIESSLVSVVESIDRKLLYPYGGYDNSSDDDSGSGDNNSSSSDDDSVVVVDKDNHEEIDTTQQVDNEHENGSGDSSSTDSSIEQLQEEIAVDDDNNEDSGIVFDDDNTNNNNNADDDDDTTIDDTDVDVDDNSSSIDYDNNEEDDNDTTDHQDIDTIDDNDDEVISYDEEEEDSALVDGDMNSIHDEL